MLLPQGMLLVICLGHVEHGKRYNSGADLFFHPGCNTVFAFRGQPFLCFVVIEHRGPVLQCPGSPAGIVALPEHVQERFIRYQNRVIIDLDRLGMLPQVMIRGIRCGPARITHTSSNDSLETPEPGVRTPESAQGKRRRICFIRRCGVYGWNRASGTGTGLRRLQGCFPFYFFRIAACIENGRGVSNKKDNETPDDPFRTFLKVLPVDRRVSRSRSPGCNFEA